MVYGVSMNILLLKKGLSIFSLLFVRANSFSLVSVSSWHNCYVRCPAGTKILNLPDALKSPLSLSFHEVLVERKVVRGPLGGCCSLCYLQDAAYQQARPCSTPATIPLLQHYQPWWVRHLVSETRPWNLVVSLWIDSCGKLAQLGWCKHLDDRSLCASLLWTLPFFLSRVSISLVLFWTGSTSQIGKSEPSARTNR